MSLSGSHHDADHALWYLLLVDHAFEQPLSGLVLVMP
jgi:hypothetical protein